MHLEVDAHGHIDILNEKNFSGKKWSDVSIVHVKRANEIAGCTLNSLLRGLFILYGKEKLSDNDLPGGIHCWEKLVEPMYVSLTSIATVDEIFIRLDHLLRSLFIGHKMVGYEAHGGLSFIYFWVLCFNIYISDINLYRIIDGVLRLGYIIEDPSVSRTIETHADIAPHLTACHKRYKELVAVADSVLRTRNHHGSLNTSGQFQFVSEPNVSLIKGIWSGSDMLLKKEKLKEALTKGPKLKLEIFGGDALMDSSDDEDVDSLRHGSKEGPNTNSAGAAAAAVVIVAPSPKIPLGYSLLQDPSGIAKDLLQVDLQELARQWTLQDHAAFCALPLHSLVGSTTSAARHALPRYKQVRSGSGYCGTAFTSRRFIDRFNATSTWVQYLVMSGTTVVDRAQIMTKLIRLAGYLSDLCNFSTMFAIISGLSQACVKRMEISFSSVAKADRAVFARLTNLMSGSKNQQKYRDEVSRITHIILSSNDHHLKNQATTTTSSSATAATVTIGNSSGNTAAAAATAESSIEWRKFIYSKMQTPVLQNPEEAWNDFQMNVAASDFQAEEHPSLMNDALEAIVPHLGAHVSEIAAIGEGNANYLSESSHLYNVEKFRLLANSLAALNKIQKLRYHLTPLRTIQAAINLTIKRHMRLGASEANEYSKQLFAISELRETPEEVEQFLRDKQSEEPPVSSTVSAAEALIAKNNNNKDSKVSFQDTGGEGRGGEERGRSRVVKKQKYIRSDAYDSIHRGTTAGRSASPSPSARRRAAATSSVANKQNTNSSGGGRRGSESEGNQGDDDRSTGESGSDDDENDEQEEDESSDEESEEETAARERAKQSALSPQRLMKSARSIFRGMSFRN